MKSRLTEWSANELTESRGRNIFHHGGYLYVGPKHKGLVERQQAMYCLCRCNQSLRVISIIISFYIIGMHPGLAEILGTNCVVMCIVFHFFYSIINLNLIPTDYSSITTLCIFSAPVRVAVNVLSVKILFVWSRVFFGSFLAPSVVYIRLLPLYSISQGICTRFCCALLCCGYAIVHNELTWSIYPYSSGLLCWHWGNR